MAALFDMFPKFCPRCGKGFNEQSTSDYLARASHYCAQCNLHYQYIPTDELLDAADKNGGDLRDGIERWGDEN